MYIYRRVNLDTALIILIIVVATFSSGNPAHMISFIVLVSELLFIAYLCSINANYKSLYIPKGIKIIFIYSLIPLLYAFYYFGIGVHYTIVFFKWICIVGHLLCISVLISKLGGLINFKQIFYSIPIIAIIVYLLYWALIFSGFDITSSEDDNYLFLSNNRRYIGYLVSVALSISLWCFFGTNKNTYLWMFLSILCSSFLFWLGGRGAFLFSLVSFWLLAYFNYNFGLLLVAKTLIISLLGAIITIPISIYSWTGFGRLLNTKLDHESSLDEVSSGRITMWKETIDLVSDRPYFGTGLDSFMMHSSVFSTHPHNFILQFLVEWGMVGVILIVAVLFGTFTRYRVNKSNQLQMLSLLVLMNLVSNGLLDGTLYHAVPLFIATLAFSAMLREAQKEEFTPKQQVCRNPN